MCTRPRRPIRSKTPMRALVKSRLARGHVEVRISLPPDAVNGSAAALNRALLEEYLKAFREAAAEHGLGCAAGSERRAADSGNVRRGCRDVGAAGGSRGGAAGCAGKRLWTS